MPDWLWQKIEPLLPPAPPHPLGCHRARIPDRRVMNAILLVLRTGMQWNALRASGICNSSTAHRRFQEWERAGVFHEIWRRGLLDYDAAVGLDWASLAADGALTKAPLGGPGHRPQPHRSSQKGAQRALLCEARGVPLGLACDGAKRNHHKLLAPTLGSIPIARPAPTERRPQGLCLDAGFRQRPESRAARRARAHSAHPQPRRGDRAQAPDPRLARPTLGR